MKYKKIFLITKCLIIISLLIIVTTIVIQRISNNKYNFLGYSIYTVITKSMDPKYQIGDILLAKKTNPNKIKVGDAIVYIGKNGIYKDKIITHEVTEIETTKPKKFHTKGLKNAIEDPIVKESQIYGKIIAKLTILSIINKFINTKTFLTLCLLSLIIGIAILLIKKVFTKKYQN